MRKHQLAAAAAVAVVTLAFGCSSSSTGPSDPFAGTWNVTVQRLIYTPGADTGTVTPAPFALTFVKGGTGQAPYRATWPALTWNVTIGGTLYHLPLPPSDSTQQLVSYSADSLLLEIAESTVGNGCDLEIAGKFTGGTAQGSMTVINGNCGTVNVPGVAGSWTATKQ